MIILPQVSRPPVDLDAVENHRVRLVAAAALVLVLLVPAVLVLPLVQALLPALVAVILLAHLARLVLAALLVQAAALVQALVLRVQVLHPAQAAQAVLVHHQDLVLAVIIEQVAVENIANIINKKMIVSNIVDMVNQVLAAPVQVQAPVQVRPVLNVIVTPAQVLVLIPLDQVLAALNIIQVIRVGLVLAARLVLVALAAPVLVQAPVLVLVALVVQALALAALAVLILKSFVVNIPTIITNVLVIPPEEVDMLDMPDTVQDMRVVVVMKRDLPIHSPLEVLVQVILKMHLLLIQIAIMGLLVLLVNVRDALDVVIVLMIKASIQVAVLPPQVIH